MVPGGSLGSGDRVFCSVVEQKVVGGRVMTGFRGEVDVQGQQKEYMDARIHVLCFRVACGLIPVLFVIMRARHNPYHRDESISAHQ